MDSVNDPSVLHEILMRMGRSEDLPNSEVGKAAVVADRLFEINQVNCVPPQGLTQILDALMVSGLVVQQFDPKSDQCNILTYIPDE